jgi:hypothetical protein
MFVFEVIVFRGLKGKPFYSEEGESAVCWSSALPCFSYGPLSFALAMFKFAAR